MTEIEKIAYAKTFIDKLANGINPLDDTLIQDDSVVNNIRISRCFFFVSDILRNIINGDYVLDGKKLKKTKFKITKEQIDCYEFNTDNISLGEFIIKIYMLVDNKCLQRPKRDIIENWLIKNEYIEYRKNSDGKLTKVPSQKGRDAGIFLREKYKRNGLFYYITYSKEAQQLLLNNLIDIFENESENQPKILDLWDDEKDKNLKEMYTMDMSLTEMATKLGIDEIEVAKRIMFLKKRNK